MSLSVLAMLPMLGCNALRGCLPEMVSADDQEPLAPEMVSADEQVPLAPEPIGPKGPPGEPPLEESQVRVVNLRSRCIDPDGGRERVKPRFERTSSLRLRGRIAVLDVRVRGASAEPWTKEYVRHADEAAMGGRRFLLDQARAHGVDDLSIDVVPWTVHTDLGPIQLTPFNVYRKEGDVTQTDRLRERVHSAIARASGFTVEKAAARVRTRGYSAVVVVLRLPTKTLERVWSSPWSSPPEVIVQLEGIGHADDGDDSAYTWAHEVLHLFGAEDLYALRRGDPRDADDVMGGPCSGSETRIGDATAWAIGFRQQRPERAYPFAPTQPSGR